MDEERRQDITQNEPNQISSGEGSIPHQEIRQEAFESREAVQQVIPNGVQPDQAPVVNNQPNPNHQVVPNQAGAPRSQYPPNVGANQTQYQQVQQTPPQYNPYYTQYVEQQQKKKKKKKNVGLMIFLISLAAVVVVSITAVIGVFVGKSLGNLTDDNGIIQGEEREETTIGDGPELEIQDNGKADDDSEDIKIEDGKVLTATQIAKKADNISVGILVYSETTNELAGEGTGILMSLDDKKEYTYVITCAHVVDAKGISITVQTNKGQTFSAEAVGIDTRTDIAVLRIKTNKLECAVFGNSDKLKVGDTVYAIGNPGGTEFFGSFTSGMVSAIDRPVNSEIGYAMKCIQHTAAINPGNSGGALLNSYGQVIGINSSKIIAAEFEGMGFSIPISDAKEIVDKLIKYGRVTDRAKLGISYYTASTSERGSMIILLKELPAGSLVIGGISEDSDLANKDVKVNDIIIAVDGKKLTESSILLEKIENGKVGDKLKLTIARFDNNYKMETFDVTVKLVEDDGTTATVEEEPVTQFDYFNPFE